MGDGEHGLPDMRRTWKDIGGVVCEADDRDKENVWGEILEEGTINRVWI